MSRITPEEIARKLAENKDRTLKMIGFYEEAAAFVYEGALDFSKKNIAPLNASLDETNAFPAHLWELMGSNGLLGLGVPVEYGGTEASFLSQIVATAAISYYSGSIGLSQLAHRDLSMGRILKHGTEEQKALYLPPMVAGTDVGALAITTSDSGSDAMATTTTAVGVKGGARVTGSNTFITNGGKANTIVNYAKTGVNPKTGKNLLTAFITESGFEGFKPGGKINKIGMRGSETYQLFFDDCFIPEKNMLGEWNKGGHILMDGFNTERVVLSAAAVGLAKNSLDIITAYTGQREQFDIALNENQALAFELADLYSEVWAVENYVYTMAAMYDRNPEAFTSKKGERCMFNELAASAFLQAGRMGEKVTTTCVKLAGGLGYTKDMSLGQNMNDMLLYQIGGGTEYIRRMVIANAVLPKPQKS